MYREPTNPPSFNGYFDTPEIVLTRASILRRHSRQAGERCFADGLELVLSDVRVCDQRKQHQAILPGPASSCRSSPA